MTEVLIGMVDRTPTPNSVASNPRNCGSSLAGRRRTLHPFLNLAGLPSFHPRRMGWNTLSSVEFGLFLARANCRATYHSHAVLHHSTLGDYGDNMSLAICIHIFQNIIHNHFEPLLLRTVSRRLYWCLNRYFSYGTAQLLRPMERDRLDGDDRL